MGVGRMGTGIDLICVQDLGMRLAAAPQSLDSLLRSEGLLSGLHNTDPFIFGELSLLKLPSDGQPQRIWPEAR